MRSKGFGAVVGRIHARIAAQPRDFHHQVSARMVAEHGFIAVEDLNIGGLARGMLAKSVHDAGWAQFLSFLKYKAESAGTRLEAVDASGTSQTCPECGASAKKESSASARTPVLAAVAWIATPPHR